MNHLQKLPVLLLILLLSFSIKAYSGDEIVFNNISVRDGLSSHIVFSIQSDDLGFIWTISPNGIDRFDGNTFKHYLLKSSDSTTLGHLNMHSGFFKDSNGKLWVYTKFGIFSYNQELDRFDLFDVLEKNETLSKAFYNIQEWKGKLIFFSWTAFYIWDPQTGNLDRRILTSKIESICTCEPGGILLGTKNGLNFYSDNGLVKYEVDGIDLSDSRISALYHHTDGTIWIGTQNNGLFLLKNNKVEQIKKGESYTIMGVKPYDNKILVATDGNGILVFDEKGKEIEVLDKTNSQLDAKQIYDIHIDSKNRVWVATYGMGIYYHVSNKKTIHPYKKDLNISHGYYAYNDTKNRLCLGTNNGLIIDADSNNPILLSLKDFEKQNTDVSNFVVNGIIQDNNQDYWIGTYGHGIYLLDFNTLKVKKHISSITIGKKITPIKFVNYLNFIKGEVWIKLVDGKLFRFNPKTDVAKRLPFQNVMFMYNNKKSDNIYVATSSGVFVLKNKERKFLFNTKSNISDYLLYNKDYSLLGTETDGLKILEHKTKKITSLTSDKKLPRNIVDILYEDENNIIILGDNAVYKIKIDLEKSKATDVKKIVYRFEANKNANIIYKNRLIMGGYEAFVDLPLSQNDIVESSRKIIFDELEVGGDFIIPEKSEILPVRVDLMKSISLDYPNKDFKLRIITPNYTNEILLYSWKLEGLERNFSEMTNANVLSYNNLPYGEYLLTVKCYSGYTNMEVANRSIKIIINPPFWATIWAYLLYLILFVGMAYVILAYYLSLKHQKDLKERNKIFAELAHEIRTPLTLIKGPIQKLSELDINETGRKLIEGVSVNLDRLNNRLNQLLDYERVNKISEELHITEFELIGFIDKLLTDFEPLLKQRNIRIVKSFDISELKLKIDEDKLEKIIYNLVSNAIKYSSNDNEISLKLIVNENDWSFTVKDNGMGIPKKNQKHIFNRFYRADNAVKSGIIGSGIGLILSYKYAKLMEGELTFESKENEGTSFTLTLPQELKQEELIVPEDVSHYGEEYSNKSEKKYDYKIAIAEDNDELRTFLNETLSENFSVETFRNGKECYEGLLEKDYDLVLSDIMMPEMNGYELCDKIKGNIETSHLPIILLTALNASMYKAEGYEHGADQYVIKPFDVRMLKFRIVSLIENRIAVRKRYQEKVNVGESLEDKEEPVVTIDSKFLDKLDDLVMANISNHEYGVQNICLDMGMSRPVLYRKLKALTDFSPKEYIQNKRLLLAKQLLERSEEPIGVIAYESGYSDPKYFSTAFKKKYGVSPSEYIKQFKQN